MTLLDRYLARQILGYTLLVMAVLLTLSSLFVFLGQQDDIGVGSYGMGDALFYTLLDAPRQFFELLPVGVLIGALVGLGNLARGSELVVIRASGVSVWRVAGAAVMAGTVLLVIGALLGEFLAPPLQSYARQLKTFAKYSKMNFAGGGGAWVKEGNRIISIQQQTADSIYGGVYVYVLDADADGRRHLGTIGRADSAALVGARRWRLANYAESVLSPAGVQARRLGRLEVESGLDPAFVGAAVVDPGTLPVRRLARYVEYLRANGIESARYETALWSRLARSASTVVLCMLAVPFAFGPLRSAGAGSRAVIGILIGVAYFLVNRTLENSGEVYDLDPLVVAWAPVAVLALLAATMIWRTR